MQTHCDKKENIKDYNLNFEEKKQLKDVKKEY